MLQEKLAQWGERAWVNLLGVAPLRTYTRLVRALADLPLPRELRRPVLGRLAQNLGMDLGEAEHDVAEYQSLGELFVRRLKPGLRPVDEQADAVVSPVDGCVSAAGRLDGDRLLQAKGIDYRLEDLLGDGELAQRLTGGHFLTIYLRPKDYHRIHAPLRASVVGTRYVPGRLFPVNPPATRNVKGLFVRNERLALEAETDGRSWALVCVGATAVGCITTVFPHQRPGHQQLHPPLHLERGDELAAFHLGSTVILIFGEGCVELAPLAPRQELRMGQAVARWLPRPRVWS
ncbi:MAG: phosphatidylserine decarboxylase [Deltaproteobacteria bacterium]|nr:phosphatidylserine decarboxylase [Deltaproteobacteria bacterium]